MERAPNVSAPMARRISKHLDSGIQPTISGRSVVLRDVILVRASGQEAPAAEEARRQAAAAAVPTGDDEELSDANGTAPGTGNDRIQAESVTTRTGRIHQVRP